MFIGRVGVSLQDKGKQQDINITNHSFKTYNYGLRNYRRLYRMRYLYWRMSLWCYFWRRKVFYRPQFLRWLRYLRRRLSLWCNRSWRIIPRVAQKLRAWTWFRLFFFGRNTANPFVPRIISKRVYTRFVCSENNIRNYVPMICMFKNNIWICVNKNTLCRTDMRYPFDKEYFCFSYCT